MRGGAAPRPITTFVGRRHELRALPRLLASSRLVTLVGPGGCGKTRLATELVRREPESDVVWLSLAPFRRHDDVRHEVARSLGILSPTRSARDEQLNDGRMLLVLDNCEHVLEPVAEIAVQVLSASKKTRVLATSREPLDVEGELVWRVPSLSLPHELAPCAPAQCGRADSVRLFVERAQLARPGFALDGTTCPSVVALCRAVDGIPLAIELAAARLRHADIRELAAHLDDLLSLLVGTRRAGDPRHRALRATLDWSYSLLDPRQQAVLRRLSIFAGGITIDAANAVCRDDGYVDHALADVTSLVDKSLLVPPADDQRYRMLEPIREYAFDRLRASGEDDAMTARCAAYLVDLVMSELPDPMGMASGASVRRIGGEFANITAILPWLMQRRSADAVQILCRFAQNHWGLSPTHVSAVNSWLSRALEVHVSRDATRVEGLLGQIQVMLQIGDDHRAARLLADEVLAISLELQDATLAARALARSAFVAAWHDRERALREYDAAIPKLRGGSLAALALALAGRAVLRQHSGDASGADMDIEESMRAWERRTGASNLSPALTLIAAADVMFQRGDFERSAGYLREAVSVERRAQEVVPKAIGFLVAPIEFLAHLAAIRKDDELALRLAGFADRVHDETGSWPRPWFALTDRRWLADVECRVGMRSRVLRAEGRRLTGAEAVALALGERRPGSLSARELAVCALVAEGLTDKEIASRLTISERTAESHVQRVRAKLGLRSRAQIGRWSAEHAPRT